MWASRVMFFIDERILVRCSTLTSLLTQSPEPHLKWHPRALLGSVYLLEDWPTLLRETNNASKSHRRALETKTNARGDLKALTSHRFSCKRLQYKRARDWGKT